MVQQDGGALLGWALLALQMQRAFFYVAVPCGAVGRRNPAGLGAPGTAHAVCIFLPRFSVDDYTQFRSGASTPTHDEMGHFCVSCRAC